MAKKIVRRRLVTATPPPPQREEEDEDVESTEDETPARGSRAAPRRTAKATRRKTARDTDDEPLVRDGGAYGLTGDMEDIRVKRFGSGCTLLDCEIGGGGGGAFPEGRVVNFAGWQSTNKTGVCIEACANFSIAYPTGITRYNDAEAAFDVNYARRMGLPMDRISFVEECRIVEVFFQDVKDFIAECERRRVPGLYIIDSLDALSDQAELDGGMDKASYGMAKAKRMSQFFRTLAGPLNSAKVTLIVISQLRDKLNVSFGEKATRAGGKALDFYASWVVWLSHIGQIKRSVNGIERVVGVRIKAKCKKNKCGPPFRECEFPVIFDYGIDDIESMADWLVEVKKWELFDERKPGTYLKWLDKQPREMYISESKRMSAVVRAEWDKIEESFSPNFSKYGS